MDDMLKRGNPWEFIDPINLEDMKIPKCADQFVRLLDAIKERYCALPQPGQRFEINNLCLIRNTKRSICVLQVAVSGPSTGVD